MTDAPASPPNLLLQRFGRFGSLALLVLAILASGFAFETLTNSQAAGGSFERRNTHELAIIAQILQRRQRDFARVAKAKYQPGLRSVDLRHPDLDTVHIAYGCDLPEGSNANRLFPRGYLYDDGDQYRISGEFVPDPPVGSNHGGAGVLPPEASASQTIGTVESAATAGKPVCFSITFSLEKLIAPASTAPDIANLLIVAPDGTVLEQYGNEKLPIAKLPQLEARDILSNDLRSSLSAGQSVAPSAPQPQSFEQGANAGTARMTIDGDDYRGYIQPFQLSVPEAICPSSSMATRTLASKVAATDTSPDAAPPAPNAAGRTADITTPTDCQLFLVGLVPASKARSEWLGPPKFMLVGFGLSFAFVLALLPLARLLLINNTESVSATGVLAIVLGLVAAAAIATLGLLFVSEINAERELAADEARAVASGIATGVGREIGLLDLASHICRGDTVPHPSAADLIDAGFFNPAGLPTNQHLSCDGVRQVLNGYAGNRRYFQKLRELRPTSDEFRLEEIVGQTDGLDKTVLARFGTADPLRQPDRYALRVATIIKSLIAPTLPPPEKFMVIDAEREDLPVLFHSRRARAGIDNLADTIEAPDRIANQLRHLVARGSDTDSRAPQVTAFASMYDGHNSEFAAVAIPHSKWVVLVYYAINDVDATAADTAGNALIAWTGLAILAAFVLGVTLKFAGHEAWHRLWPFEAGACEYRRLARQAMILSVVIVSLRMGLAAVGANGLLDLMPAIAVIGAALFMVHAFRRLGSPRLGAALMTPHLGSPRRSAAPLTPGTERAYLRLVLSILICTAGVPMILFWADARTMSRAELDIKRSNAASHDLNELAARWGSLKTVLGERWAMPPLAVTSTVEQPEHGLTARMQAWVNGAPEPTLNRCKNSPRNFGTISAERSWFCIGQDGIGVYARPLAFPSPGQWLWIVIFTVADLVMFYTIVAAGLEALTGFGIPLGAVTWPKLVIGRSADPLKNELDLTRKSLLVAPQQAVRDRLAALPATWPVNLSDQLLPAPDDALKPDGKHPPAVPTPWQGMTQAPAPVMVGGGSPWARLRAAWGRIAEPGVPLLSGASPPPPWLIVSGLELVLRNGLRRRAALAYLERAASVLAVDGQTELTGMVIIAEMAPLERILDAFESFAETDVERLSTREELRWAQLFQDFSTFYFAPIDKVNDARVPKGTSPEAWALIEELRWLPGGVIDGVIVDHTSRAELALQSRHGDKSFPLSAPAYQQHYTPRITCWANSLGAKTSEAAVDYMRANLIEHYEQCWAASSFAERVILDAIAHHAFINMRKGVALQSLVRRGLVILDPVPRLMNRSFALYLRQTERPDTLAKWKKAQPRSAWSAAQLPLALLIPAVLLLLALGAAESGQTLSTFFPLLVAGLPAVISLLTRTAKQA